MVEKYKNYTIETNVAVMRSKMDRIERDVNDIKKTIKADYVTQKEFQPIVDKVKSIESAKDWIAKIIIGAVIVSLLALLGLQ